MGREHDTRTFDPSKLFHSLHNHFISMGGFFGTVSQKECVADLFYGTDYNSHLGTRRGGLAAYDSQNKNFTRSIHNLENAYFRSKFEPGLSRFAGATSGIGVISDTDAQPLVLHSHLGRFAIVTVAKVNNIEELVRQLLNENCQHRQGCLQGL